jgi:hypothetical protein
MAVLVIDELEPALQPLAEEAKLISLLMSRWIDTSLVMFCAFKASKLLQQYLTEQGISLEQLLVEITRMKIADQYSKDGGYVTSSAQDLLRGAKDIESLVDVSQENNAFTLAAVVGIDLDHLRVWLNTKKEVIGDVPIF